MVCCHFGYFLKVNQVYGYSYLLYLQSQMSVILEWHLRIITNQGFMMELRNIFNATPNSTWQVLCDSGVGFYIPPYQREYNWDRNHIDRLFEDVSHGLGLLVENKDSITFLGTLIVIDRATLPDADKSQLPNNVRLVIDGQQRLTTILLMNICLHDEIRRRGTKFKEEDEKALKWLYYKAIEVENRLQKTFEEDMNWGEEGYQWYPRVIRAYDDQWSRLEEGAKYKSPIAEFIHGYSNHIRGTDSNKQYTGTVGRIDKTNSVLINYGLIRRKLRTLSAGSDQDLEMPPLDEVAESAEFQETILKAEFPGEVCSILLNEDNEDFKQLIRLVLLANFLMERVTVTVVSAYNEDYAFDMFESLNTTGEPLTAFETFKPKVIEIEGLTQYKNSRSRAFMEPIENYLGKFKKAQERQNGTNQLLLPFALAETGEKLSKRHSDQRRYLRDQYDKWQTPEERHKFLQHLSYTAIFIEDAWKKSDDAFESTAFPDRSVILMCMDVLGKLNHEIAIGPLVRFYSHVQLDSSDFSETTILELEKAIKTITAFSAFWRGIGKTTGDLASQYRELMEKGFDELGNQAFCRCPENGRPLTNLTANKLQEALKYVLKDRGGINSKDDWVRLSSEQAIYKASQPLARFLLFAAMHNTDADEENPGLRLVGRKGVLNMLLWEKWKEDLTIEHVAPQESEDQSWSKSLYETDGLVDRLGNLTLLPQAENSSFGCRAWRVKKEMYRVLSLPTQGALETHLAETQNLEIPLSESTKDLLRAGNYLQHLSAISNIEEWTPQFVQDRSVRLAELIWTNIAPWLGLDD